MARRSRSCRKLPRWLSRRAARRDGSDGGEMTKLRSSGLATSLLAAICMLASRPSLPQDWPNRPVKVVVPFAAAGTTDRMGRLVSEELSKAFKQQFYVENRAGGGGVIA